MRKKTAKHAPRKTRKPAPKVKVVSRWVHQDSSEINVESKTTQASFDPGSHIIDRLTDELEELKKLHIYLLRDSAKQAEIIAYYRRRAADELERSTAEGLVRLAT